MGSEICNQYAHHRSWYTCNDPHIYDTLLTDTRAANCFPHIRRYIQILNKKCMLCIYFTLQLSSLFVSLQTEALRYVTTNNLKLTLLPKPVITSTCTTPTGITTLPARTSHEQSLFVSQIIPTQLCNAANSYSSRNKIEMLPVIDTTDPTQIHTSRL